MVGYFIVRAKTRQGTTTVDLGGLETDPRVSYSMWDTNRAGVYLVTVSSDDPAVFAELKLRTTEFLDAGDEAKLRDLATRYGVSYDAIFNAYYSPGMASASADTNPTKKNA